MTITAPAPQVATTPLTPLPLPEAGDVIALQSVRDYPAVSVLLTTEGSARMTPLDKARLDALVTAACARLDTEFGRGSHAELRRSLTGLADDAAKRPTRSSVALFASPGASSSWSLPVPVADRQVVDPTFATRDLVRALHRTPRHVVLVLTDRDARLYDGSGETLVPARGSAFPLSRDSRGVRGARTRSDDLDDRGGEAGRDAFLRTVDAALNAHLRVHPAPLVLVGAQRMLSRFTQLSRSTGRLAGTVQGSHARTPLHVLAGLVRPVLESYLLSRQQEALALLEQRTSAQRVVTGMPSVWLAARAQRPEMLAVEQGLFYPARLSEDGDELTPATDVEHPEVIDDAVDEVIEMVLQRGGWIALVDDGALASQERIALSLRSR